MTNHIYIDCKDLQAVDAERKVTGESALDTVEVRKINAENVKKIYITIRNISAKLLEHLASTLPTMNTGELRQSNIERMITEFEPGISNAVQQIFLETRSRVFTQVPTAKVEPNSRRYEINKNNPEANAILIEMAKLHEEEIRNILQLKFDDTWPDTKEVAQRLVKMNRQDVLPALLEYEVLKTILLKAGSIEKVTEKLAQFLGGEEEAKKIVRILKDLLILKNAITE